MVIQMVSLDKFNQVAITQYTKIAELNCFSSLFQLSFMSKVTYSACLSYLVNQLEDAYYNLWWEKKEYN